MNDTIVTKVHWSFWLIGIFFLTWNVSASVNFIVQMIPDITAIMPDTHRAIIETRPIWATAGFALGAFAGALACLLLLLRNSIAYPIFIASLLGTMVTMIHTINIANSVITFNSFEKVMMIVLPIVVSVFLIWYAKMSRNKNWIN